MSQASPSPQAAFSVLVQKGVAFELRIDGTAWTYTGVVSGGDALRYDAKRYEPGVVVFGFTPLAAGEYLQEYVRNDLLKDDSEYRYVRVIVAPDEAEQRAALFPTATPRSAASPASTDSAGLAFSFPLDAALPSPSPDARAGLPPAGGATAAPSPEPSSPASRGEALFSTGGIPAVLGEAGSLVDAGRADAALSLLDWLEGRAELSDEALWQKARALEAPGPARDVQSARAALVLLMERYPESARYQDAAVRIAYLDRHYLRIR